MKKELYFKVHSDVLESDPYVNLNDEGDIIMDNVTMFDFKENWNLVEPYLYEPEIVKLLDKGMAEYVGRTQTGHLPPWDLRNGIGPWEYSSTTATWNNRAMDMANNDPKWKEFVERFEKKVEFAGYDCEEWNYVTKDPFLIKLNSIYWDEFNRVMLQFFPQPGTYEWYQCLGAERYLAPWQKALAERIFPDYVWEIMDINCSQDLPLAADATIVGTARDGSRMIFDLLKFEYNTAEDILKCTKCTDCNCAV